MLCGALWTMIRLVGNSCLPVVLRLAMVQRLTLVHPKGNVVGIDPVVRSGTSSIPVNQSVMRNLTEES
jgi:hypothetical protein